MFLQKAAFVSTNYHVNRTLINEMLYNFLFYAEMLVFFMSMETSKALQDMLISIVSHYSSNANVRS